MKCLVLTSRLTCCQAAGFWHGEEGLPAVRCSTACLEPAQPSNTCICIQPRLRWPGLVARGPVASLTACPVHRLSIRCAGRKLAPRIVVALLPVGLWPAVLSALPHKEERFLYVTYPLVRPRPCASRTAARHGATQAACSWLHTAMHTSPGQERYVRLCIDASKDQAAAGVDHKQGRRVSRCAPQTWYEG